MGNCVCVNVGDNVKLKCKAICMTTQLTIKLLKKNNQKIYIIFELYSQNTYNTVTQSSQLSPRILLLLFHTFNTMLSPVPGVFS